MFPSRGHFFLPTILIIFTHRKQSVCHRVIPSCPFINPWISMKLYCQQRKCWSLFFNYWEKIAYKQERDQGVTHYGESTLSRFAPFFTPCFLLALSTILLILLSFCIFIGSVLVNTYVVQYISLKDGKKVFSEMWQLFKVFYSKFRIWGNLRHAQGF